MQPCLPPASWALQEILAPCPQGPQALEPTSDPTTYPLPSLGCSGLLPPIPPDAFCDRVVILSRPPSLPAGNSSLNLYRTLHLSGLKSPSHSICGIVFVTLTALSGLTGAEPVMGPLPSLEPELLEYSVWSHFSHEETGVLRGKMTCPKARWQQDWKSPVGLVWEPHTSPTPRTASSPPKL